VLCAALWLWVLPLMQLTGEVLRSSVKKSCCD
jgi:hypothetical protein